jgi:hypothetical protein
MNRLTEAFAPTVKLKFDFVNWRKLKARLVEIVGFNVMRFFQARIPSQSDFA